MFAKASIHLNCKVQIICVKTNIRVNFTPPKVMDEECVKILYSHHRNLTMCQRVVEIRMNEGINDSSKQLEPDFSKVYIQRQIGVQLPEDYVPGNYLVVYGYDYFQCIYEVENYASLSVLQKFEIFIEKIPHDSPIAFICNQSEVGKLEALFVPLFVEALLRYLERKTPIVAESDPDPDIFQTWLSNNEPGRDLIARSSALINMKAKFIINLSYYSTSYEQVSASRSATSQYTFISLPLPSPEEDRAMRFLSSEKNKQSDEAYTMHRNNMENYLGGKFEPGKAQVYKSLPPPLCSNGF